MVVIEACVYRDSARFLCHGEAVLRNLEGRDVVELVALAGAVHNRLLGQGVPLGIASPVLNGEPHRPADFSAAWLASRSMLHGIVNRGDIARRVCNVSRVASGFLCTCPWQVHAKASQKGNRLWLVPSQASARRDWSISPSWVGKLQQK